MCVKRKINVERDKTIIIFLKIYNFKYLNIPTTGLRLGLGFKNRRQKKFIF